MTLSQLTQSLAPVAGISLFDQITLAIAIAGFLLSLSSWVYTFATQRKNIKVKLLSFQASDTTAYSHVMFVNYSRLAIAITDICLTFGKETVHCSALPTWTYTFTKKDRSTGTSHKDFFSTKLPIEISPLGAANCLVLFQALPRTIPQTATHLSLVICTNRGRAARMTLPLPPGWAGQNNRS